jgi:selenocysteine lyase/cysteine desulfurase
VRRSLVRELEPRVVGWTALAASADYADCCGYRWEFVEGARKFEVGTQPLQDLAGFAESMELLAEVGPDRILAHVTALMDPLARRLRERGRATIVSDLSLARRSGIFAFRYASTEETETAFGALSAAGVNCVMREGAIRLSPHLYNTADEVATVMDVLERAGW